MPFRKTVEYSIDREFDDYLRGGTRSKVLDESLSDGTFMSTSWHSKEFSPSSDANDNLASNSFFVKTDFHQNNVEYSNDKFGRGYVDYSTEKLSSFHNERCPAADEATNYEIKDTKSTSRINRGAAANSVELVGVPVMVNHRDEPAADDYEMHKSSRRYDICISSQRDDGIEINFSPRSHSARSLTARTSRKETNPKPCASTDVNLVNIGSGLWFQNFDGASTRRGNDRSLPVMVEIADQLASYGMKSFSFRVADHETRQGALDCSKDEEAPLDRHVIQGHDDLTVRKIDSNLMSDQFRPPLDIQFASDSPCLSSLQCEDEIEVQMGQETEDMSIIDAISMAQDEALTIVNSAMADLESTGREFEKAMGTDGSSLLQDIVPGCLDYISLGTQSFITSTASNFASVCEVLYHAIQPAQEEFEILLQEKSQIISDVLEPAELEAKVILQEIVGETGINQCK